MKNYFAIRVLTVFTLVVCTSVVFAQEMRTWTDSTGKFTIEASLVSVEGNTVELKNKAGKVLILTIDKLSEADNIYLKENPIFENPFEMAEWVASKDLSTQTSSAKTVDINDAKEIGDYGETTWSCPPDPAPLDNLASKRLTFRAGTIPLYSYVKDCGFFFSRDGKKVLYALQVPKPSIGEGDDSMRIFLGDIASGEIITMKNSLCLTPYGLSPDGTKAMFVQNPWGIGAHNGQKGNILIFDCTSNQLELLTTLNPIDYQGRSRTQDKADVESAFWVSDDHILILYSSGNDKSLVLANINTGKALWRLKADLSWERSLTFSPNGTYFLVKTGKAMLLIETLSGKTIGTLTDINGFGTAKYSFSPDGQKIASCASEMIRIWDATTGQSKEAFYIDGALQYSTFTWVSNQHLLAGNKLIDTTLQVPIWEYRGLFNNGDYFGGQFWYMMGNNDAKTLVGVKIPQQKVFDRFSSQQNDSSLFAVQPGMTVALKIDSSISKDSDEIRRSFEKKLQDNELTLADDSPVTFLLKVLQKEERTVTYTTGGAFPMGGFFPFNRGGGMEVKFRPEQYEILFQQEDKTLWSCVYLTRVPDVSLDEVAKESLQDIVNRKVGERHYKDWFLGQDIPKQIPRTDNLGKSTFSELGIREN